jgi:hypothetical protein
MKKLTFRSTCLEAVCWGIPLLAGMAVIAWKTKIFEGMMELF